MAGSRAFLLSGFRVLGKAVLGFFALALLLLLFRALTVGQTVSAAINVVYPSVCLGGWAGSALAAGEPETPAGTFSLEDSAYLDPTISAPLYCAMFGVTARATPPYKVFLTFDWSMP